MRNAWYFIQTAQRPRSPATGESADEVRAEPDARRRVQRVVGRFSGIGWETTSLLVATQCAWRCEPACAARVLRDRGRRTRRRANLVEPEHDATLFLVSTANHNEAGRPGRGALSWRATHSCSCEGNAEQVRARLTMLESVRYHPQSKSLDLRLCVVCGSTVGHNPWQANDFGYPATVGLLL